MDDTGKKRILVLQRADPCLVDKTNDVVVRPTLNGALSGLVPCPGRAMFFLGADNRIVDGDVVVVIFSRCDLPVVIRFSHVDALVARILKDGTGQVAGIHPLERDF